MPVLAAGEGGDVGYLVGSGILAVLAWIDRQWGFLLLEGVWAVVSLYSLLQLVRGQPPTAPDH